MQRYNTRSSYSAITSTDCVGYGSVPNPLVTLVIPVSTFSSQTPETQMTGLRVGSLVQDLVPTRPTIEIPTLSEITDILFRDINTKCTHFQARFNYWVDCTKHQAQSFYVVFCIPGTSVPPLQSWSRHSWAFLTQL